MRRKLLRDTGIICLFVLAVTLPFLNQSYQLDDEEFIRFARVKLEHPLQPFIEDHDYVGLHFDVFRTTHPPLLSTLIAATIRISGGEEEAPLHAAYLIFPLTGALAMYWLGRRFTDNPLAASLLLAATPGFVVASHSLMGDLPGLALSLAAVTSYIYGIDLNRGRLLILSAILLVLALMTAYQSLVLLPLLAIYAALNHRISWRALAPLAVMAVSFVIYCAWFRWMSGELPAFSYGHLGLDFQGGISGIFSKSRALLAFIGGAAIFPLAVYPALLRKWRNVELMIPVVFLLLALSVATPLIYGLLTLSQALLLAPLLTAGIIVIARSVEAIVAGWPQSGVSRSAVWNARRGVRADDLFLALWLLGVCAYGVFWLPYVSVRYILPLFPPLVLLFIRGAGELFSGTGYRRSVFLPASIVLTLAVALPIAYGNYRAAGAQKGMAQQFSSEYPGHEESADDAPRIWFVGEFGFRYYMEKEGFRHFGTGADSRPGDIIIREDGPGYYPALDRDSEGLEVVTLATSYPLRLNVYGEAGFNNHRAGPIPWTPSSGRLTKYTIHRLGEEQNP